MIRNNVLRLSSLLLVAALALVGCGEDESEGVQSLTLRIVSPDGGLGFPASIQNTIDQVRIRVYQNGREQRRLQKCFEYSEDSGALPVLPYGENYQLVVEALGPGQDCTESTAILADGATPSFDYSGGSGSREVWVFVTEPGHIEFASTLYEDNNQLVSYPTEFEGRYVAESLGLDPEDLGGQRAGHTVTELPDGRLLVVGGARLTSGSGLAGSPFARFIDSVEIYDPSTGYWTIVYDREAPPVLDANGGEAPAPMRLSRARAFHTATLMPDGRVLIAGGVAESTSGSIDSIEAVSAVDLIDLKTGTIEQFAPGSEDLVAARAFHTAHLVDGRVYMVGGMSRTFDRPGYVDTVEVWDPARAYFEPALDPDTDGDLKLEVGRGLHAAATMTDGIVVSGGRTESGVTDTVEMMVVEGDSLRLLTRGNMPRMSTPRFGHSAELMTDLTPTDGRQDQYFAVAGGFTSLDETNTNLLMGGDLTGSIEFLDTWTVAFADNLNIQMTTPRAHFQMVETTITKDLMFFGGIVRNDQGLTVSNRVERMARNADG
ncbi:MAG: hypothetical protein KC561_13885, partial [Myxococcales bacterium]|nr:hypothetical protein [Myxococcales bacterium]